MNLKQAKEEFAARLYLWSNEEMKQEVKDNFARLRMLGMDNSDRFLNYIKHYSSDEASDLMKALLKFRMPEAAQAFGEAASKREIELVEVCFKTPPVVNKRQEALLIRQLNGEKNIFADRKLLRAAIKEELVSILGSRIFQRSAATWVHTTDVNGWRVNTNIDTGGRYHQLSYWHYIADHDVTTFSNHPNLADGISVLSWLGIQSGATQWSHLTNAEVPGTVQSLSNFCSHFMTDIPKLLSGIDPI